MLASRVAVLSFRFVSKQTDGHNERMTVKLETTFWRKCLNMAAVSFIFYFLLSSNSSNLKRLYNSNYKIKYVQCVNKFHFIIYKIKESCASVRNSLGDGRLIIGFKPQKCINVELILVEESQSFLQVVDSIINHRNTNNIAACNILNWSTDTRKNAKPSIWKRDLYI